MAHQRISLAKRAGQPRGWQSITFNCRGEEVTREYKTFQATSCLVSGEIRVVLMRDEKEWVPYFCTDPTAEVRDILEVATSRWAIEEQFHDVKEVWGAGQQQVRNVWSTGLEGKAGQPLNPASTPGLEPPPAEKGRKRPWCQRGPFTGLCRRAVNGLDANEARSRAFAAGP